MTFVLARNANTPYLAGRVSDGHVTIQVLEGPGVWLAFDERVINPTAVDSSNQELRDGFFISPAQGVVSIPWSGPAYLYNPVSDTTTVFGVINITGCVD